MDYITKDHQRPNVTVKCNATVNRVIIDSSPDGTPQAKGFEYVDNNGTRSKVFAREEVIVAGGTYASPAILLRSGIGPKANLEALNTNCQVDLPGVGKNLQDHQLIFT